MGKLTRKRVLKPAVETMEERTLLSTTTPLGDVVGLQADASKGNLAVFLSELALVETSRGDVQQFAQQTVQTVLPTNFQVRQTAQMSNVIVPASIADPADQQTAKAVLATVGTPSFDQTFLSTLATVEQQSAQAAQSFINTTSNPAIKQVVQPQIAQDGQIATQAQTLLDNLNTTNGGPVTAGAGTDNPSTAAEYVQWSHAMNNSEILLSQAASLATSDLGVQLYANKLVNDHTLADMQVHGLAAYLGTSLSAMPTPMGYASARNVLSTLTQGQGDANFNMTYLATNVQAHQSAINTSAQISPSIPDPNVQQFIQNSIATDFMHEASAQRLLDLQNGGNTGGNPFAPLVRNIDTRGITNLHQSIHGPRNGHLFYNLRFQAGGLNYNQTYKLDIHGRSGKPGALSARQAVELFLYLGYNQIYGATAQPGLPGQTGQPGLQGHPFLARRMALRAQALRAHS